VPRSARPSGQSQSRAVQEAHEIVALVRSLRRGLLQAARAELSRSGLTGAQLNVVSLLGSRGPMTLSALSHELAIGHSTVSGIVDRLQARGIAQRQPNPSDRRYTLISLTEPLTQRAPALIAHGPGSRLIDTLAAAPPHERQTMREGLSLLQRYFNTWSDARGSTDPFSETT
jgi:MarR family transcriptional regulator, organic hydroperoxide resistance regulator